MEASGGTVKKFHWDAGHSVWKWIAGKKFGYRRHAMVEIPETIYREQERLHGAANMSEQYVHVRWIDEDGKESGDLYYVVGDLAEEYRQYGLINRTGVNRWTKDYVGVQCAAMMAEAYKNGGDAEVYVLYPPGDGEMIHHLTGAILGRWWVECKGVIREFNVTYVEPCPEPEAGIYNAILSDDGTQLVRDDIGPKDRVLILDLGGGTFSMISSRGTKVDYIVNHSEPIGINDAIKIFTRMFRSKYGEAFKSERTLNPARVREAMLTGEYRGGGNTYPCQDIADRAMSQLISNVKQVYDGIGGASAWDVIIATGGGMAAAWNSINQVLEHGLVIPAKSKTTTDGLAVPDLEWLFMANAEGLQKRRRMYDAIEVAKLDAQPEDN